jgi:hypothetical protein
LNFQFDFNHALSVKFFFSLNFFLRLSFTTSIFVINILSLFKRCYNNAFPKKKQQTLFKNLLNITFQLIYVCDIKSDLFYYYFRLNNMNFHDVTQLVKNIKKFNNERDLLKTLKRSAWVSFKVIEGKNTLKLSFWRRTRNFVYEIHILRTGCVLN